LEEMSHEKQAISTGSNGDIMGIPCRSGDMEISIDIMVTGLLTAISRDRIGI